MSAYQCSDAHLWALASLLTQRWPDATREAIVNVGDTDAPAVDPNVAKLHGTRHAVACAVFARLHVRNAQSVAYRYNERPHGAPPYRYAVANYVGPDPSGRRPLDVGALTLSAPRTWRAIVAKSVACYRYQACEHPEFPACEVAGWLTQIEARVLHSLPGWSDAAWGWDATPSPDAAPVVRL